MLDAGGVDDSGRLVEAVAVEARGRLVDQLVVEHLGQGLLVVVAADDRHRRDRGRGRNPQERSGAISPRRAASPSGRSSTEAGKTSETCLAISCSVAVIPM